MDYVKHIMSIPLFFYLCVFSEEVIYILPHFLFKLCIIITFLGVYIFIVGLITLTLFQGHVCVRNINCKLLVLDSSPPWFTRCMVVTYIQKIMHDMICVTLVYYSREIIDIFWSVKCLGLSKTLTLQLTPTP